MTAVAELPDSITPSQIAALITAGGKCELIDVRTPAEYSVVHAEGARLMPLDSLDAAAIAASCGGGPLYILCKSGGRARKARDKLRAAGFANAIVVEGGTDAWLAAGLPAVRGTSKVISLERQVRIAAGLFVILGVVLALTVTPWLLLISGVVGGGLVFAGVTDTCGMGMLLSRMPWNRCGSAGKCCGK